MTNQNRDQQLINHLKNEGEKWVPKNDKAKPKSELELLNTILEELQKQTKLLESLVDQKK